eukprot:jgi/Astpho2/6308/fgenesh1_pg.00090_%23_4_t
MQRMPTGAWQLRSPTPPMLSTTKPRWRSFGEVPLSSNQQASKIHLRSESKTLPPLWLQRSRRQLWHPQWNALSRSVTLQEEGAGSHTDHDAASPVAGNGRHEMPAAAAEAEPAESAVAEAERNAEIEKAEHEQPAASHEAEHEVPAAEQAEGEEPAAAEAELEAPEGLSSNGGDSPVLVERPQAPEAESEAPEAEAEAPEAEIEALEAEAEAKAEAPSSSSHQIQAVLADSDSGRREQEQPSAATSGSSGRSAQPGATSTECPIDVRGMLEKAAAQAGSSQEAHSRPAGSTGPRAGMGGSGLSLGPAPRRPGTSGVALRSGSGRATPTSSASGAAAGGPQAGGGGRPSTPAGLGSGLPGPRQAQQQAGAGEAGQGGAREQPVANEVSAAPAEDPKTQALRAKVQALRVLLVRIAMRLTQSLSSSVVQQVNHRLDLAERLRIPRSGPARPQSGLQDAVVEGQKLEQDGPGELLPLEVTVLVIGPKGVGKSSTINSLLGENRAPVSHTGEGREGIRMYRGDFEGIPLRLIDTPGLEVSQAEMGSNLEKLGKIKRAYKKHKPDIVMYVDRADVIRRNFEDEPLLRTITQVFGQEMWFNTIVVFTHSNAQPPDNSQGQPLTFEQFFQPRQQVTTTAIRQAAQDRRLMCPMAGAENHPRCRRNEQGQPLLVNGVAWQQYLMLLMMSTKLLTECDKVLKIREQASASREQRDMIRMMTAMQRQVPMAYLMNQFASPHQAKRLPQQSQVDQVPIPTAGELKKLDPAKQQAEERRRRLFEKQAKEDELAHTMARELPPTGSQVPMLVDPTFEAVQRVDRYTIMQDQRMHPASFAPVKGDPIEFDDNLHAFHAVKDLALRKPGTYIDGIPARAMTQVSVSKDAHHVMSDVEMSFWQRAGAWVATPWFQVQGPLGGSEYLYSARVHAQTKRMLPEGRKGKLVVGLMASRTKEGVFNLPKEGPWFWAAKTEARLKVSDWTKASATAVFGEGRNPGAAGQMMGRKNRGNQLKAGLKTRFGDLKEKEATLEIGRQAHSGQSNLMLNNAVSVGLDTRSKVSGSTQFDASGQGVVRLQYFGSKHLDGTKSGLIILLPLAAAAINKLRSLRHSEELEAEEPEFSFMA